MVIQTYLLSNKALIYVYLHVFLDDLYDREHITRFMTLSLKNKDTIFF